MGFFKPNVKKMERDKDLNGLIEALNHKDLDVRRKAAGALARLGDQKAVAPLIKILTDLYDPEIGKGLYLLGDVASALGEIGDKRAVKPIKLALERPYLGVVSYSPEDLLNPGAKMYRRVAEMNRPLNYFKEAAKEALEKIKTKES